MYIVATIIGATWAVFWLYWLAAAVGTKPGRLRWGRFAGVRLVTILVVVLLVRAHVFRNTTITNDPKLQGVGLALFLAGLVFAVWARRYLGRNWGTPMSQKVEPELVTTGPYRRVRHPIYSGIILAMTGTAVAISWYWLILAALVGGYFAYSALVEERYMTGLFPEAYPAYKRSTKMLIPFVF